MTTKQGKTKRENSKSIIIPSIMYYNNIVYTQHYNTPEEVGHGWPLLIRSLMRVAWVGVVWSRAQFWPAHSSFIGLTWLLSIWLYLSVYQSRLLALLLLLYKVSANNCYIRARDQATPSKGTLISDLISKGQRVPTSSNNTQLHIQSYGFVSFWFYDSTLCSCSEAKELPNLTLSVTVLLTYKCSFHYQPLWLPKTSNKVS